MQNNILDLRSTNTFTEGPLPVISTATNFAETFTPLGAEIPCAGCQSVLLWFATTIEDSEKLKLKFAARSQYDATADPFYLTDETITVTSLIIGEMYYNSKFFRLTEDQDQFFLVHIDTRGCIPSLQVYQMADVVGATPGQFTAVQVTLQH